MPIASVLNKVLQLLYVSSRLRRSVIFSIYLRSYAQCNLYSHTGYLHRVIIIYAYSAQKSRISRSRMPISRTPKDDATLCIYTVSFFYSSNAPRSVSIFILYLSLSAESAGFPTSCYILVDPAVYFRTGQMQACDIDPIIHVVFRTM